MPYRNLLIVLTINALIMFAITYVTVDELGHAYLNINRAYSALMMTAPMGIMMLAVMHSMFQNRKANITLYSAFTGLLIVTFLLIRTQTPIGDDQFLRSMIPHHSGAILMCEQAPITEPEIATLCEQIVKSQKEEIARMEAIMARRP